LAHFELSKSGNPIFVIAAISWREMVCNHEMFWLVCMMALAPRAFLALAPDAATCGNDHGTCGDDDGISHLQIQKNLHNDSGSLTTVAQAKLAICECKIELCSRTDCSKDDQYINKPSVGWRRDIYVNQFQGTLDLTAWKGIEAYMYDNEDKNNFESWPNAFRIVGDNKYCKKIEFLDEDGSRVGYKDNVVYEKEKGNMPEANTPIELPSDLQEDLGGVYMENTIECETVHATPAPARDEEYEEMQARIRAELYR